MLNCYLGKSPGGAVAIAISLNNGEFSEIGGAGAERRSAEPGRSRCAPSAHAGRAHLRSDFFQGATVGAPGLLDKVSLFCIFMNVRIELYGESVRIIGIKKTSPERCWGSPFTGEESGAAAIARGYDRMDNNICRARGKVREYGLCNDWDYFATFTLNAEKQDRFDLSQWVKDFGNWIQNYKKKYRCTEFAYLIIPEQHKSGAWHAHGLLRGLAPESLVKNEHGYLDLPYYAKRFGYISLDPVKDKRKCASYITKYVSKDARATARALRAGQHLYYQSRGLKGKEILEEWEGDFDSEWENDFVKIKWMTLDEYQMTKGEIKSASDKR